MTNKCEHTKTSDSNFRVYPSVHTHPTTVDKPNNITETNTHSLSSPAISAPPQPVSSPAHPSPPLITLSVPQFVAEIKAVRTRAEMLWRKKAENCASHLLKISSSCASSRRQKRTLRYLRKRDRDSQWRRREQTTIPPFMST